MIFYLKKIIITINIFLVALIFFGCMLLIIMLNKEVFLLIYFYIVFFPSFFAFVILESIFLNWLDGLEKAGAKKKKKEK